MSTVHDVTSVFLGSFVLRNYQHWEHAAPFLCKACQRCSLMNHNGPLWEVVTASEMGRNRQGGFSHWGDNVVQRQDNTGWATGVQPAQHPWMKPILSFWEAQKGRMYPVGKMRHWAPSPLSPPKPPVLARQFPPMWEFHQQRWRDWGIREDKSFFEVHHFPSAAFKVFLPSCEICRAMGLPAWLVWSLGSGDAWKENAAWVIHSLGWETRTVQDGPCSTERAGRAGSS